MKATTINSKENIFGTCERTPGQNLMRAVTGYEQLIGIPPYNYESMFRILNKALTPEEVNLLCRGYGFGVPRQTQKNIASELGVNRTDVSVLAHRAVAKLQRTPYKSQLRKLVPTLEEMSAEIAKLRDMELSQDRQRALEGRLQSATAKVQELTEANSELERRLGEMQHELSVLKGKYCDVSQQLAVARQKNITLIERADRAERRSVAIERAFKKSLEVVQTTLSTAITDAETTDTLNVLGLSDEAAAALRRVSITELSRLCEMRAQNLSKLGVGPKNLAEIQMKLQERGLSLRNAS